MSELQKERQGISFSPSLMAEYIYNGKENHARIRQGFKILSEDPILKNDVSMLSKGRIELTEMMYKKTLRAHEVFNLAQADPHNQITFWFHNISQYQGTVSFFMFIPYVQVMGTPEQVEKWAKPALESKIIGAYAQTELGHGSDIQGLETTATFDPKTDEFIINSPTLTSTKWWPGELGINANYCVCFAKLLINGKSYGIQSFIVQIRDTENNKPLPNIELGDIGPHMGYITKDNGFLRFNNVRIPRENMLMRYNVVTKSGEFQTRGNPRISYAVMMQVRDLICHASWMALAQALTISIRYSIVRTQFKGTDKKERKVLDYLTQQDKLLTCLAATFAMHAGAHKVTEMIKENLRRVELKEDFSLMADVHAVLSCCKAFYTWETLDGIGTSRMACGGHGFSAYSGLVTLYNEFSVNPTHEGENTVMALQTARYLIGCASKLREGKKLPEGGKYLEKAFNLEGKTCQAKESKDFDLEMIDEALIVASGVAVKTAATSLIEGSQKLGMKESWDKKAGIDLVEAARAHCYYYSFQAFRERLQKVGDSKQKAILEKLCLLYGIDRLIKYPTNLFESGYFGKEQLKLLRDRKVELMALVRPEAIGLVDSFEIPDNSLKSALGVYNGNVYETLWNWVRTYNDFNFHDWSKTWENNIKAMRNVKFGVPKL